MSIQAALSRRALLQAAALLPALAGCAPSAARISQSVFTLGVASGDPAPDGVVLWTRLCVDPLGPTGYGLPPGPLLVHWEVAHDQEFRRLAAHGMASAAPERAYAVHVEVQGLEPLREYFYRFRLGSEYSPVGRTKTLPEAAADVGWLRFAFVSCSDYQAGFFNAYRHLAEEELDFILHLGDYIYEYGPEGNGPRRHNGPEVVTLDDYRRRYALYRADPDLQAAHAAAAWIAVPDDHEVENNYAAQWAEERLSSEAPVTPADFLRRRAAAYQAYYENMPLRRSSLPRGSQMQLYRRFGFGRLARFSMLDTRQYRSDQPCGDGFQPPAHCPARAAENGTLTGPEQERWLLEGLANSPARWNVTGQQVMLAQFLWPLPGGAALNLDGWDGYAAGRSRLLGFLQERRPSNPVILTGDIHSAWVHDVLADFDRPESAVLATELVTTSLSAEFPEAALDAVALSLSHNPHTRYFHGAERGYARCEVTRESWRTDFRVVNTVLSHASQVRTHASFVIEDGQPGARLA
ncbi:alkaline phosphatase D family protein [Deinococcus lacus]|uniref:Alkaline phosphatase D family protein n=1 Tax=Deinococcus lacus TaxID=392561 RepID=A0ABW1YGH4_9DEIO